MFTWITYSTMASWTAAVTLLTWQHYRLNPDLPYKNKMEYLLVSHFTKLGCSTIYKMNRNFHYFSWHTCLCLATDQTELAKREGASERDSSVLGNCYGGSCHCFSFRFCSPGVMMTHATSVVVIYILGPGNKPRGFKYVCSRQCRAPQPHEEHWAIP